MQKILEFSLVARMHSETLDYLNFNFFFQPPCNGMVKGMTRKIKKKIFFSKGDWKTLTKLKKNCRRETRRTKIALNLFFVNVPMEMFHLQKEFHSNPSNRCAKEKMFLAWRHRGSGKISITILSFSFKRRMAAQWKGSGIYSWK